MAEIGLSNEKIAELNQPVLCESKSDFWIELKPIVRRDPSLSLLEKEEWYELDFSVGLFNKAVGKRRKEVATFMIQLLSQDDMKIIMAAENRNKVSYLHTWNIAEFVDSKTFNQSLVDSLVPATKVASRHKAVRRQFLQKCDSEFTELSSSSALYEWLEASDLLSGPSGSLLGLILASTFMNDEEFQVVKSEKTLGVDPAVVEYISVTR